MPGSVPRIPWKKVEPLLLQAALSPTADQRAYLLSRIAQRYSVALTTLRDRLSFLQVRQPVAEKGYAALEEWDRQMRLLIAVYGSPRRLRVAVTNRAFRVRQELERNRRRSVTLAEAARMLRIPRALLRVYCHDLELLAPDREGKIPLPELRNFFAQFWWLVKTHRYIRRTEIES